MFTIIVPASMLAAEWSARSSSRDREGWPCSFAQEQ